MPPMLVQRSFCGLFVVRDSQSQGWVGVLSALFVDYFSRPELTTADEISDDRLERTNPESFCTRQELAVKMDMNLTFNEVQLAVLDA